MLWDSGARLTGWKQVGGNEESELTSWLQRGGNKENVIIAEIQQGRDEEDKRWVSYKIGCHKDLINMTVRRSRWRTERHVGVSH